MNETGNRMICRGGHNLLKTVGYRNGEAYCTWCAKESVADSPYRSAILYRHNTGRMKPDGSMDVAVKTRNLRPYVGHRKIGTYTLDDNRVLVIATSQSIDKVIRRQRRMMGA